MKNKVLTPINLLNGLRQRTGISGELKKASEPKVSVIMPVYNRAYTVRHAINGIIDQTFTEWELIIVDDGSTDSTIRECERFAYNDQRIKVYSLSHTGQIGRVRNYGNRLAKGELLVVQDSDDVSFPDRLEVLWNEYKRTKADVFYHAMYMTFRDTELDMVTRQFRPAMPYEKDKLLQTQYIPGQVAYTKKAVIKVPYEETMKIMDDWQILIELALNGYKFHPIQRALYDYWYTPDSVTLNGLAQRKKDLKTLLRILREKYKLKVHYAEAFERGANGEILKDEKIK